MNKVLIQHSVYIVLSLPEIQELVDKIVQLSLYHHCPRMPLCVLCFQTFRGEKTSGLFKKSGRSEVCAKLIYSDLRKLALTGWPILCKRKGECGVGTAGGQGGEE